MPDLPDHEELLSEIALTNELIWDRRLDRGQDRGLARQLPRSNGCGGIGIYIRFDGAVLKAFEGPNLTEDVWNNLFIHYFELFLAREYAASIKTMVTGQPMHDALPEILQKVNVLLGGDQLPKSLNDLISVLNDRLAEVSELPGRSGVST